MTDAPAPVTIIIPGKWTPELKKQVSCGTFTRRVDMPKAVQFKATASFFAAEVMKGHPVFDEPIRVDFIWEKPKPSGYKARECWPWKRPDLNNLTKLIEDALQGVVYRDDSQICDSRQIKRFGPVEQLTVRVEVLEPEWPYRKPPKVREAAERGTKMEVIPDA